MCYLPAQKSRIMPMPRQCHMALLFGVKDKAGKMIQEGGFKDDWSLLEALIYHKAAKIGKETGAISFLFEKFSIPMTTFGTAATPSLEESDDAAPPPSPASSNRRMAARPKIAEEKKKKDPRIPNRMAWLEFYQQHQADFDALYDRVTENSMQGSWGVHLPAQDDDDEGEEEKDGLCLSNTPQTTK